MTTETTEIKVPFITDYATYVTIVFDGKTHTLRDDHPFFTQVLENLKAGKHEEARVRALARIKEFKEDIDAYVSLAWSLVAMGRYQEAELYATQGYAIRKDPRLAQALGEAFDAHAA